MREKFLIVGSGGREAAFAQKLQGDGVVYAVIAFANPTIVNAVITSGGEYLIADSNDGEIISQFALKNEIDYAFISADEPLANGVVDALLANNIKAVGGTRAATRIEWDKIYAMEMMASVCPQFTPFYRVITDKNQLHTAVAEFKNKNLQIVVKPQGLTGGKGVKVMPEHLPDYQDCIDYAQQLLAKNDEKVLLVEKIIGIEFTIMGLTDGQNLNIAPATYDYPFRYENDQGDGTGGMGCFTSVSAELPFMSNQDLADCKHIMQQIIDKMRAKNLLFNGVLNGGFFKTKQGIKFMEFNSRFGDPEALNILLILSSSFAQMIRDMWHKKIDEKSIQFIKKASVVKYLVGKEYPAHSAKATQFSLDEKAISKMGVRIFFGSAVAISRGQYQTLKKSRVIAFAAIADKIANASALVDEAIDNFVSADLDYRRDIGSEQNLQKLKL